MPDEVAPLAFIDANVWLYAFIAADDAAKTARAGELIRGSRSVVSVQVINEVCVNLLRRGIFAEAAMPALIDSFFATTAVIHPNHAMLVEASKLRERYSLSFWDSQIVASALQAGTPILYTEDMQHGLVWTADSLSSILLLLREPSELLL